MRTVRIIIVDDHPLFRRGLRDVIEEQSSYKVVGEATDGEEAIRLIQQEGPDIVIVDIGLPKMNGFELVRRLRKMSMPPPVIFLTMYKDEDLYNAAMDLGVKAYVVKDSAAEEILTAIQRVLNGGTFISPVISEMKLKREKRSQELLSGKPQLNLLTPTERKILKLIAEDRTSKEIAAILGISIKTVENHRQNICHKLGLHGSHSLLRFAFEHRSLL